MQLLRVLIIFAFCASVFCLAHIKFTLGLAQRVRARVPSAAACSGFMLAMYQSSAHLRYKTLFQGVDSKMRNYLLSHLNEELRSYEARKNLTMVIARFPSSKAVNEILLKTCTEQIEADYFNPYQL